MDRRLKSAILVLSFVVILPSPARAQLKDNLEINLFGGGSVYNDKKFNISFPQSTFPIQEAFRLNKAIRAGLRVGVYTRGHWSEEFFYSYEPSTAHFIRRTPPSGSLDLRLRIHNYGITALYYFQENESRSLRPFLSIGVGGTVYSFTPEAEALARDPLRGNVPGLKASHVLTLNYGVGVKARTKDWIGFRADLRGLLGPTPAFGIPHESSDPNAQVFPAKGAVFNGEASAGVVFYFSKKR
jgi:hypothetical protein